MMTLEEFEVLAKQKLSTAVSAIEAFFEAHPDIESDAASALKDAAADAADAADAEVDKATPTSAHGVIDAAIAAVDAKTAAEIAILTTQAEARKAELASAKAAVPE